jgi:hypothetical protein
MFIGDIKEHRRLSFKTSLVTNGKARRSKR